VEDHTCSVVHMVTQLNSPIDCFISGWHSNGLGKAEEDLRGKGHMDAVYQILRYLKSAPGKGLIYRKNGHLNIEGYAIQTGLVVLTTGSPRLDTAYS
jgi:hypothetical protein